MGRTAGQCPAPRSSRPINDSWIAACYLIHDLSMATVNTKDFADYADNDRLNLVQASAWPAATAPITAAAL